MTRDPQDTLMLLDFASRDLIQALERFLTKHEKLDGCTPNQLDCFAIRRLAHRVLEVVEDD